MILDKRYPSGACLGSATEIKACPKITKRQRKNCISRGKWVHDRILRLRRQRRAVITGGVIVESLFPEAVKSAAGVNTAQRQNVFRSRFAPEHAGLLAAGPDQRLAPCLDHPEPIKKPWRRQVPY